MGAKLRSLRLLQSAGLNTPIFEVLSSTYHIEKFILHNNWERISIRTDPKVDGPDKWDLPFFPNLRKEEAYKKLRKLRSGFSDLNIIVSKGINPKDARLSAKYFRNPELEVVEYLLGSSTVRDIDKNIPNSIIYRPTRRYTGGMPDLKLLEKINSAVYAIRREILSKVKKPTTIVEFSVYKYPVGRIPDEIIFWEII